VSLVVEVESQHAIFSRLFDQLEMEDTIDLTVSSESEDIDLSHDIIDDGTLVSLARPTPRHTLGL
jgi:hypothetical protein